MQHLCRCFLSPLHQIIQHCVGRGCHWNKYIKRRHARVVGSLMQFECDEFEQGTIVDTVKIIDTLETETLRRGVNYFCHLYK